MCVNNTVYKEVKLHVCVSSQTNRVHTIFLPEFVLLLGECVYLGFQLLSEFILLRDFDIKLFDQTLVVCHLHVQQGVLLRLLQSENSKDHNMFMHCV